MGNGQSKNGHSRMKEQKDSNKQKLLIEKEKKVHKNSFKSFINSLKKDGNMNSEKNEKKVNLIAL